MKRKTMRLKKGGRENEGEEGGREERGREREEANRRGGMEYWKEEKTRVRRGKGAKRRKGRKRERVKKIKGGKHKRSVATVIK